MNFVLKGSKSFMTFLRVVHIHQKGPEYLELSYIDICIDVHRELKLKTCIKNVNF